MNIIHEINIKDMEEAIDGLEQYVEDESILPLLSALEALKQDTSNKSLLVEVSNAFMALGIIQGAVLTYAPYLSVLLSNDLFQE